MINIFEGGNLNLKSYCSGNREVSCSSTIFLPYVFFPLLQVGTRLLWQLSYRMTTEPCLPTLCSGITVLLEGRVPYITFQLFKRGFILTLQLSCHLACIYIFLKVWKSPRSQRHDNALAVGSIRYLFLNVSGTVKLR